MAIAAGVQVGLEGQTFDFFSLCSLSSLHWASEEQTERTIKRMGGQSSERQCGFQNEQKKREERERRKKRAKCDLRSMVACWDCSP